MATRDAVAGDPLAPQAPRPAPGETFPAPLSFALIDRPLDYLLADHDRQRAVCALLRRFAAERQAPRGEADRVVAFLTHDLALHHADEDDDLFPLLRRRTLPEEALSPVLARLSEDHRRAEPMVEAMVEFLSARPASAMVRIDTAAQELFQAYAAAEQRHLALENSVVLAIAAVRLTRRDLETLSRAMKARRGVAV